MSVEWQAEWPAWGVMGDGVVRVNITSRLMKGAALEVNYIRDTKMTINSNLLQFLNIDILISLIISFHVTYSASLWSLTREFPTPIGVFSSPGTRARTSTPTLPCSLLLSPLSLTSHTYAVPASVRVEGGRWLNSVASLH